MALINYVTKEVNCKIVYYGPGLSGKTTNIKYIYEHLSPDSKGKLVSLATEKERTLFFDFLPLDLGTIKGFKTRFHIYTTPGQVFYSASRKLILKNVDGLVFVADSQIERMDENIESLEDMIENLKIYNLKVDLSDGVPIVFQYNKRDLPNIAPISELQKALNRWGAPYFEAIAIKGINVFETLKEILKLVIRRLSR